MLAGYFHNRGKSSLFCDHRRRLETELSGGSRKGTRGARPPLTSSPDWGPKGQKIFVLETPPPPLSQVWIWHWSWQKRLFVSNSTQVTILFHCMCFLVRDAGKAYSWIHLTDQLFFSFYVYSFRVTPCSHVATVRKAIILKARFKVLCHSVRKQGESTTL